MIDSLITILRDYPAIALFLTLGAGFFVGRIRFGMFSLGSVTSVLIIGVLVGQLNITIGGPIKSFFFMMFLFSIGYSVGPDFFKSLRGQGAKQALFAVLMSSMCFISTLAVSYLLGYSKGETVGLFSGSQTCSALLGVGSEAISRLNIPETIKQEQLNIIPVCYAVTYIFGTLGTVILLGNLGPKLLGGIKKVKYLTVELERSLSNSSSHDNPYRASAFNTISYRAFTVNNHFFDTPRTVKETEEYLRLYHVFVSVDRIRHGDEVFVPKYDQLIYLGDNIVLCGHKDNMLKIEEYIGKETSDRSLMDYTIDRLVVLVTKKGAANLTVKEIMHQREMHGVMIRSIIRDGHELPIESSLMLHKGDLVALVGRSDRIKNASKIIGIPDKPTVASDMIFVGFTIAIGGILGALCFWIDQIPISFGTSGGALIAGLVSGWYRSKHPSFGQIPRGALWLMNNLGLNTFIAVVGIEAGPSFVQGIISIGPMLFVAGAINTLVPLFFGLWIGHKWFKFNPAITLGCCAGTRTCTASLGAVQNALGSSIPAIGYTVTYAVSNILLVIWGLVTVLLV